LDKLQNHATPFLPTGSWIDTPFKCSTQSPFILLHRHVFQFFLFVIWLFFWSLPAQAQNISPNPIEITPEFTEKKIGKDISIFEDLSGLLTFEQVRAPEMAALFLPSTKEAPNFGYSQSAYWASFVIQRNVKKDDANNNGTLYLILAYAPTDLAELWCTDAVGKIVVQQRAGGHVPLAEWPSKFRMPTFHIAPTAYACWVRVYTKSSIQLTLSLYSGQTFINMNLLDNAVQAMYFGALLVMFVYNGLIAIATLSFAYLSYSAFLLSFGLFQFAFGGLGYALLWRDAIGFADRIVPLMISCTAISSLFFTSTLLYLNKNAPLWFYFSMGLAFIFGINLVVPWMLPFSISMRIIYSLGLAWAIIQLGCGSYLAWYGFRIAKIFLLAWVIFILGTLVALTVNIGLVSPNFFTVNSMQIGSTIEFILLSFALADRIKTTQTNLLNAQKKIAEGLRLSEQELTQKVQQRTAALEAAKNQAELAQHETAQALADLKATQSQLIEAERLASLGQLVGGVAHEINNPIGVIRSNSELIAYNISLTMQKVPLFIHSLQKNELDLFQSILEDSLLNKQFLSSKEERQK
jgi:hypothetical protein